MCYTEKKLTQKGKSTMSQLHTEKQRKYFAEAILLHSKKYQQDVRQRQRSQWVSEKDKVKRGAASGGGDQGISLRRNDKWGRGQVQDSDKKKKLVPNGRGPARKRQ